MNSESRGEPLPRTASQADQAYQRSAMYRAVMSAEASRQAEQDKEAQRETESLVKVLSGAADLLLKIVPPIALGYGLAAAFLYFFLLIHFYPAGVTVGDTLLFVFIALGYGVLTLSLGCAGSFLFAPLNTYEQAHKESGAPGAASGGKAMAFFVGGALSVIGLTWLLHFAFGNWTLAQDHPAVTLFVFAGVAFLVSVAINAAALRFGNPGMRLVEAWGAWMSSSFVFWALATALWPLLVVSLWPHGWFVLGMSTISGMLIWMAIAVVQERLPRIKDLAPAAAQDPAASRTRKRLRLQAFSVLFAGSLVAPLVADALWFDGALTTIVIRMLGMRSSHVAVELKGQALVDVRQQLAITAADLSICNQPDGSAIVSPVTILWHGMGKRSYIALGSGTVDAKATETPQAPRLEIDASEMKTITDDTTRCHDLPSSVYFESKAVQPASGEALPEMEAALWDAIESRYGVDLQHRDANHWQLERALVWGHADNAASGDAGNELLARQRAACIALAVDDEIRSMGRAEPDPEVEWAGFGARSPDRGQRLAHSDGSAPGSCDATDRRVSVRLIFRCLDGDGKLSGKCPLDRGVSNASDSQARAAIRAFRGAAAASDATSVVGHDRISASIRRARAVCPTP